MRDFAHALRLSRHFDSNLLVAEFLNNAAEVLLKAWTWSETTPQKCFERIVWYQIFLDLFVGLVLWFSPVVEF